MPQHRRLTRPGAIHPIGYWQDTDPALEGPVAAGVHWFDSSLEAEGEIIERIRNSAADGWIVGPGGGTVKSFAIPLGNGTVAVLGGIKATIELPGAGRFVRWALMDPHEAPTVLEMDVWVKQGELPTITDTIVGTTPPTIAAVNLATALVDPEDWTASWVAGSFATFVVDAGVSGVTGGTAQFFYVRE